MIKRINVSVATVALLIFNYCADIENKDSEADVNESSLLPVSSTNEKAVEFYRKAMDNMFKEKYIEARGNFISALELDPDFILANLYINEPDVELKEKYRKRAFSNYSKANPYELFVLKSDSLVKEKGWRNSNQERKDLFNTIEDIYSDIPEIYNIKANIIGNKYWGPTAKQSIEIFKKATDLDPSFYKAYHNLMEYKYIRQDKILQLKKDENFYAEFNKDLSYILNKFPNNTRILSTAAKLYSNSFNFTDKKRLDRAIDLIEKSIKISKKNASSNLNLHYRVLSGIYSNGGKIKESFESFKLALDSAEDDQQLIDTYFDLFSIHVYNGKYLEAIKSIDEFALSMGGFGLSEENILKCRVGLNFYKSVIYAHANQSMRTKESLNKYAEAAHDLMDYFGFDENDPELGKKINALPGDQNWRGNMWRTMAPGWSEDNFIWLNTIIGDHSYSGMLHAKKEQRTGERTFWIDGISEVLKGNVKKGYEIFTNNTFLAYHQYFLAQAALNLGKEEEAKSLLEKITAMPPLENFFNDFVIVRSRNLLETL